MVQHRDDEREPTIATFSSSLFLWGRSIVMWSSTCRRHGSSYSPSSRTPRTTSSSSRSSSHTHTGPQVVNDMPPFYSSSYSSSSRTSMTTSSSSSSSSTTKTTPQPHLPISSKEGTSIKTVVPNLPSSSKKGNCHIELTLHNNISSTNHQTGLDPGRHFWSFC
jgi:hypothetical protein